MKQPQNLHLQIFALDTKRVRYIRSTISAKEKGETNITLLQQKRRRPVTWLIAEASDGSNSLYSTTVSGPPLPRRTNTPTFSWGYAWNQMIKIIKIQSTPWKNAWGSTNVRKYLIWRAFIGVVVREVINLNHF